MPTYLLFSSIAQIDALSVHMPDMGDLEMKGAFDFAKDRAEFDIDLLDFNFTQDKLSVSSEQKKIPLRLVYENNTSQIRLLSESTFLINKDKPHVKPTDFYLHEGRIYLHDAPIAFNDEISPEISAH